MVSGLCWRYHNGMQATFDQIHDGAVGEIVTMQCSYNTRGLWKHPVKTGWSDMEYQLRNWLYYTWLSGDFITEQHVHSLDKMAWAMQDEYPISAAGPAVGKPASDEMYGNIYRSLRHRLRVRQRRQSLQPAAGNRTAARATCRTTSSAEGRVDMFAASHARPTKGN